MIDEEHKNEELGQGSKSVVQELRRHSQIAHILLPPKKIRLFSLIAISYFCVAGGPFGIEPIVQYAPVPFWLLILVAVFPWIWSLPTSLVCAELASTFPEDGGIVLWTEMAFGRIVGYFIGFCSIISNIMDSSLYPNMFMSYLMSEGMLGSQANSWLVYGVGVSVIFLISLLNIIGIEIAGVLNIAFFVLSSSPFMGLFLAGFRQISISKLFQGWDRFPNEVQWGPFLASIIWNNSGWYSVGYLVGETHHPQITFPRAMIASNFLLIAMYILPLAIGLSIGQDRYEDWNVGEFSRIGQQVGGRPMVIWFALSGMIAACGLYNASLMTSSECISFMANNRMAPKVLRFKSSWFRTPIIAILTSSVFTSLFILFPLSAILRAEMVINAFTQVVLFTTFLVLRFREPQLERPYRVPVNKYIAIVVSSIPVSISIWSVLITDWKSQVAGLAAAFVALITYPLMCYKDIIQFAEEKGWIEPGSTFTSLLLCNRYCTKRRETQELSPPIDEYSPLRV